MNDVSNVYQGPDAQLSALPPQLKLPHSKLGVASFVMILISGVIMLGLVFYAAYLELNTEGGIDEESTEAVLVGLGIIVLLGSFVVSLGLGIAGICQKNVQKVFSILGVIFSSVALLGVVGLLVLGFYVG